LGAYQGENLAQVLTMVEVLRNVGVELEEVKVREGLLSVVRNTGMQGRWQVLGQSPLRVVDVAHNIEGIDCVLGQAAACLPSEKWAVVLGVSADKDLESILQRMPRDARYYFAAPDNPRSLPAKILAQKANAVGLVGSAYPSVEEAWNQAVRDSSDDGLVLALGSFFVVAEIPVLND
jgi:dihydrofolate synthase/folylpolyglutamate synthase